MVEHPPCRPPPDTERVRRRPTTELWLVVALAVAGVAIGLFVTRHGVAITDDSQTYIGAARNLADGKGITVPFTNVLDGFSPRQARDFGGKVPLLLFPPLFSVVLAPFERLGIDSVDALRFLNPLLLGDRWRPARVARLPDDPLGAPRSPGPRLRVHAYLLQLFGFVQSEPFYLVLSLLGLLVSRPTCAPVARASWSSSASSPRLACLTRVVGVSLVAAGVIAVIAWSAGPIRDGSSAPRSWELRRCSPRRLPRAGQASRPATAVVRSVAPGESGRLPRTRSPPSTAGSCRSIPSA